MPNQKDDQILTATDKLLKDARPDQFARLLGEIQGSDFPVTRPTHEGTERQQ